MGKVIRFRRYW